MNSPLRILHVTVSLGPGGMEKVVAKVALALTPRGFEFHVACLEQSGTVAAGLPHPENVHVLHKPARVSPGTVYRLMRTIFRVKPHVLHTHNLGPLLYGVLASGFGLRVPVMHGEHGVLKPGELRSSRLWLRRQLFRGCGCVHTVSNELRESLVQAGFRAQDIGTVINGVDAEHFRPLDKAATRSAEGIPGDALVIGTTGRLSPEKRQELLVRALGLMVAQNVSVYGLVVGDGGERRRLEALAAAAGCGDRVRFVGYREDTVNLYNAMDLFVLPSDREGLSNALLEAMACGVPVLASSACGNREVVAHGSDGWLFPFTTAEELAKYLATAVASREALVAMGRKAREHALREFPFAKTVDRYEQVYRAVAARKRVQGSE